MTNKPETTDDDSPAFDIEDLTLNELGDLEMILGTSLEKAQDEGQAKLMQGLLYIMKRRDDADFTMADAGEYSLKAVTALLGN